MKSIRVWCALLLAIALVMPLGLNPTQAAGGSSVSWLHTSGILINDQSGLAQLNGVNFMLSQGIQVTASDLQNAKALGFNTFRVNEYWGLMQPYNQSASGIDVNFFSTGVSTPMRGVHPAHTPLDSLVNWAVQYNMYMILCVYGWTDTYTPPAWAFTNIPGTGWSDNGTQRTRSEQAYSAVFNGTAAKERTGLINTWRFIANRYGNVPNVIFEILNEPFVSDTSLAGASYSGFNTAVISAIQSVEAQSHLKVIQLLRDHYDEYIINQSLDVNQANVVWASHVYSPMNSYDPNGSYWRDDAFTWHGKYFPAGWGNGTTYVAWKIIRAAAKIHSWNQPWMVTEFSKLITETYWKNWFNTTLTTMSEQSVSGWDFFCYSSDLTKEVGWNIDDPSVQAQIMPVLQPYLTINSSTTTSTSTSTPTTTSSTLTTSTTQGTQPSPIALDQECSVVSGFTMGSTSCSINAAPNALVIMTISSSAQSGTTGSSAATIGGKAATNLANSTRSGDVMIEVWYRFIVSPSNPTSCSASFPSNRRQALTCQSFTGTASSPPFFQGTNSTRNGRGASPQTVSASIAAGTSGRWEFQASTSRTALDSSTTITSAPSAPQTNIINANYPGGSSVPYSTESNYQSNSGTNILSTNYASGNLTLDWVTVVTSILPAPMVTTTQALTTSTTQGTQPSPIALDQECSVVSGFTMGPTSCSINAAPNALVIMTISSITAPATGSSAATIGGVAATNLANVTKAGFTRTELWYRLITSPSNPTSCSASFSSNRRQHITCQSFTGTATNAPFFEDTNSTQTGRSTNTATASAKIASGTLRRMEFQISTFATNLNYNGLIAASPAVGQTQITIATFNGNGGSISHSTETNYKQSSTADTLSTTCTGSGIDIAWATIVTGILPGSSPITTITSLTTSLKTTLTSTSGASTSSTTTSVASAPNTSISVTSTFTNVSTSLATTSIVISHTTNTSETPTTSMISQTTSGTTTITSQTSTTMIITSSSTTTFSSAPTSTSTTAISTSTTTTTSASLTPSVTTSSSSATSAVSSAQTTPVTTVIPSSSITIPPTTSTTNSTVVNAIIGVVVPAKAVATTTTSTRPISTTTSSQSSVATITTSINLISSQNTVSTITSLSNSTNGQVLLPVTAETTFYSWFSVLLSYFGSLLLPTLPPVRHKLEHMTPSWTPRHSA